MKPNKNVSLGLSKFFMGIFFKIYEQPIYPKTSRRLDFPNYRSKSSCKYRPTL
jgi:hypothetical protein